MPTTTAADQAAHLRRAAQYIVEFGLWNRPGAFADAASDAQDVPSAIYRSTQGGRLIHPFVLPGPEAVDRCKALITANTAAMDTIRALAAWIDRDVPASPEANAAAEADPIDALARWTDRPGVTAQSAVAEMRALARELTPWTHTAA